MDNELINNEGNTTGMIIPGIKNQIGAIGIGFAVGAVITVGTYFAVTAISKAVKAKKASKIEAEPAAKAES